MQLAVLCVDDDPDALALLEILLEREGLRVRTARDAGEALRSVSAETPALILLDYWMPGTNPYELIGRLRAAAPAAKIVLVTGADDAPGLAADLGAEGHFGKPFGPASLRSLLGRVLPARA